MADPLPELAIDIEGMKDLLVALLGEQAVRNLDHDLLGAMAYGITLVRQAPVELRMEAMGMRPGIIADWGRGHHLWIEATQ